MTNKTNNNTKIRQNKCLVHRVPSGVAILSHVCGIAAIVHPHSMCVYLENINIGRQGILVSYQWEKGMGVAT